MSTRKIAHGIETNQGASRAWEALTPPLAEWILEAVSSMGLDRMTPVQASTIPLFIGNKDVVVEAVTGSGKTLSFLVPVIEKLLRLDEPIRKHHIGAIIISPTRELAKQIYTVLISLLAFHAPSAAHLEQASSNFELDNVPTQIYPTSSLKVVPQLLLGGNTTPAQDLAAFLRNSPNLLISTPGRLLELLASPHVHCPQSSFEVLVLDEADRLLDLGFKNDLQSILQRLPKQRRTGLFSASVSEAVDQLVRVGLRNPVRIAVKVRGRDGKEDQRTPASLQMTYLTLPPIGKLPGLLTLLTHLDPQPTKSIAYLSTCAAVDYYSNILPSLLPLVQSDSSNADVNIISLHGRQSPTHRTRNFNSFLNSTSPTLLLTTDVAARGLDIPQVDLTIQLDPPSDPKTFLHRAGRAGRAGRKGLSVVFLLDGREGENYPSFLEVRKTPVNPLSSLCNSSSSQSTAMPYTGISTTIAATTDTSLSSQFTQKIRSIVLKDRQLHDKAQRAFVSWVRSYSKHAASSIFRVSDLQWIQEAEAWGLLRLPRMPELKLSTKNGGSDEGKSSEIDRSLGLTIDWDNFAYKDVQAEKKRKAEMISSRSENAKQGVSGSGSAERGTSSLRKGKKDNAWSSKHAQQAIASSRREKKAKKREKVKWAGMSEEQRKKETELKAIIGKVRERVAMDGGETVEKGKAKG